MECEEGMIEYLVEGMMMSLANCGQASSERSILGVFANELELDLSTQFSMKRLNLSQ